MLLHGFNVFLHAVNGLLVGFLAYKIFPCRNQPSAAWRWGQGYLAAALFLAYPFSFQAVPWISALSYSLVAALVLGALLFYARYQAGGGKSWAAASLVLTFLAPFAHESGVAAAPLLILFEATRGWVADFGKRLRRVFVWLLPLLLWFLVWVTVPNTRADTAVNNSETLWQNSFYYLQGAGYPLTWLGGAIRARWGGNDLVTIALLAVPALLLAFGVQYYACYKVETADKMPAALFFFLSPAAYPWYWIVLTSLPAIWLLSFGETLSSPRLLLLPSVGIAWLWGNVFVSGGQWAVARLRSGRWAAASAFLLIISLLLVFLLGQNYRFVRQQMTYHRLLGSVYWQAAEKALAANEKGDTAIFINFPNELRSHKLTYPLGHEGVIFYVDYLNEADIVNTQTGRQNDARFLRADDIREEATYAHGVLGSGIDWPELLAQTSGVQVFLTSFNADHIELEPAGGTSASIPGSPPLAIFSDETGREAIVLHGAEASWKDSGLYVTLLWEANPPVPDSTTVFVQVFDANGQMIAQKDGFPLARTYAMTQWPQGQIVQDVRVIPFQSPPESGRILVGLYNGLTGERLAVKAADDVAGPDNSVVLLLPAGSSSSR